ncbi:hypothetical protein GIW70_17770 [Pseudomonas syringae]|nr:hypothetical protein [Pseudomonas syringae]MCF5070038.1 hypothetical protein [Pseudomonas syringae]
MADSTLVQPHIPEMKVDILGPEPIDAGLPLALTYLYPEGVKVLIEPAPSASAKDHYVVRLNGDVATEIEIAEGEASQQATVYVPAELWKDKLNVLEYGLQRATVEIETSQPLQVWFNTERPGQMDRFPDQEGHSELSITVPNEVLEEGVDPERARLGVEVSVFYPLMRAFDMIQLYCNGEVLRHIVNQDEVEQQQPIRMMIDEATFLAAGDNPQFPVRFTVLDRVGNGPDVNSPDSVTVNLFVRVKGTWFDPPIVSEDPNDSEDDPDVIDLEKLAGKPATAQVYVSRSWLKDDEIQLTCRFQLGDETERLTLAETVKNVPFMYSLPVPHACFLAAAGGSAVFSYTRVSAGVELDRSTVQRVSIKGASAGALEPPVLVGAGDEIDPLAFAEGITARVEYLEDQPGDQARINVQGTAGIGSPPLAAVAFNKNHRANFLLKAPVLAANQGNVLKLSWALLRGSATQPSRTRDVTVKRIEDNDWRLPIPTLPQSLDNQVLDLVTFTGPAQA